MSILSEIEKIKDETFGVAIIDGILLIIPGLTFIFYFSKELFLALDIVKLILLSISLMTPFLLLNIVILAIFLESNSRGAKENVFMSLTLSLIISAVLLYIVLLSAYVLKLSFGKALILACSIQLILELFILFGIIKNRQKKT